MSSGRVASSHPAFNLHTFRPCDFLGFWGNVFVLHRANEPIYSVHGISLPSPAGKGQHGRSQRGIWARKSPVRGISLKVAPLAETLLLGGQTSAPPKIKRFNPEHNAISKIVVRKLQERGNWPVDWFHGKMAHTRGYKGEKDVWLKQPERKEVRGNQWSNDSGCWFLFWW